MKFRHLIVFVGSVLIATGSANAGVTTFAPRLTVSEEHTDNLLLANTNQQEDYITKVSPGFDLSLASQQSGLDLSYTAGYITYKNYNDDDFLRHDSSLSIWTNLSQHTRAQFQDFFLWTNEPYQQTGFSLLGFIQFEDELLSVLDTSVRTGLNEYYTNTAIANLTHQMGEKSSVTLQGLFGLRKELNSEFSNDNKRYIPSINLTYWPTPGFGFDFSATYTRGVFKNGDDFHDWEGNLTLRKKVSSHLEIFTGYRQFLRRHIEGTSQDYMAYLGKAGITYEWVDNASISLGGGYFLRNPEEANADNTDGYYFDASANKDFIFPRGEIHFVLLAQLDRNDFGTEQLGMERIYGIGASAGYRLTLHLTATFNVAARVNDYLNTENDRRDYLGNAGCGLIYSPRTWLSFSTTYYHNLLRGREDTFNYDENTVRLTVSFTPKGFRYN